MSKNINKILIVLLSLVLALVLLPSVARAMDVAVYTITTLSVFQDNTTTLGAGTAVCTALDISGATATCTGTIQTGLPYRFEVSIQNNGAAAGTPSAHSFNLSVGASDVLGTAPTAGSAGCDDEGTNNSDWTNTVGATDVDTAAGTVCSIASGGDTDVFYMILTPDTDAASADGEFFLKDGGITDTSASISFTIGAAPTTIDVSGTLYSDEGTSQLDGGSITVNLAVATSTVGLYSTTTDSGSGAWKIEGIGTGDFGVGTPFSAWIDGDVNTRAYGLTKASSTAADTNITGFDLYQNRLIVKHEATSGTSTTNADLAFYDNDNDPDIQFTAVSGGALDVFADQELHVWTGDTFAPGGTVTVHANASSTTDGSAHIDDNATFTAGGSITVGGNWDADTGSTFTHNTNVVTFNASTTGKTIAGVLTGSNTFDNVIFNDASGAWTFSNNASTTDFTITNGSITAPTLLTVAGNYSNSGDFTDNSGTVFFSGSGITLGGEMTGAADDFSTIEFLSSGTKTFNANASTSVFTIQSGSGAVDVSTRLITIAGVFTNDATFTTNGTSKLFFTGSGNIAGTLTGTSQLRDVEFLASRTFAANASTTVLTIASGATLTAPALLTVAGNYTNNGDFTDGGGSNTVFFSGAITLAGQMTGTADDFNHVEFLGAVTSPDPDRMVKAEVDALALNVLVPDPRN